MRNQSLLPMLCALLVSACVVGDVKKKLPQNGFDRDGSTVLDSASSEGGVKDGAAQGGGDARVNGGLDAQAGADGSAQDEAGLDATVIKCPGDCTSDPAKSLCSAGSCVACQNSGDCAAFSASAPACIKGQGCFECSSEDTTICPSDRPHCDPTKHSCVECTKTDDCKDPKKSVCSSGKCVPCTDNAADPSAGCTHIENDLNVCFNKECVQCTPDTEAMRCGKNSCNPFTHACTSNERGKTTICKPCLADSECEANHRCIAMNFDGTRLKPYSDAEGGGGYCLQLIPSCPELFGAPAINRESLSGAAADKYCGVNESLTTCDAILKFGSSCASGNATDCGAQGGRCESVNNVAKRCTYSCQNALECATNAPCGTSGNDRYCGQ